LWNSITNNFSESIYRRLKFKTHWDNEESPIRSRRMQSLYRISTLAWLYYLIVHPMLAIKKHQRNSSRGLILLAPHERTLQKWEQHKKRHKIAPPTTWSGSSKTSLFYVKSDARIKTFCHLMTLKIDFSHPQKLFFYYFLISPLAVSFRVLYRKKKIDRCQCQELSLSLLFFCVFVFFLERIIFCAQQLHGREINAFLISFHKTTSHRFGIANE
jgi:hypothetical protein